MADIEDEFFDTENETDDSNNEAPQTVRILASGSNTDEEIVENDENDDDVSIAGLNDDDEIVEDGGDDDDPSEVGDVPSVGAASIASITGYVSTINTNIYGSQIRSAIANALTTLASNITAVNNSVTSGSLVYKGLLSSTTNLNNMVPTGSSSSLGIYVLQEGYTYGGVLPSDYPYSNCYGLLIVYEGTSGLYARQELTVMYDHTSNPSSTKWFRTHNAGVWSNWITDKNDDYVTTDNATSKDFSELWRKAWIRAVSTSTDIGTLPSGSYAGTLYINASDASVSNGWPSDDIIDILKSNNGVLAFTSYYVDSSAIRQELFVVKGPAATLGYRWIRTRATSSSWHAWQIEKPFSFKGNATRTDINDYRNIAGREGIYIIPSYSAGETWANTEYTNLPTGYNRNNVGKLTVYNFPIMGTNYTTVRQEIVYTYISSNSNYLEDISKKWVRTYGDSSWGAWQLISS